MAAACGRSRAATIVFLVLVVVAALGGSSMTAAAAWVGPFNAHRQSSSALPRAQHQRQHARRGAAALSASLLLSDPALLEHAASLLATQAAHAAQHDPTGATLLFLADNPLTEALPDTSELLKQLPKLNEFDIPKVDLPQQLPSQLQDALKVRIPKMAGEWRGRMISAMLYI